MGRKLQRKVNSSFKTYHFPLLLVPQLRLARICSEEKAAAVELRDDGPGHRSLYVV